MTTYAGCSILRIALQLECRLAMQESTTEPSNLSQGCMHMHELLMRLAWMPSAI